MRRAHAHVVGGMSYMYMHVRTYLRWIMETPWGLSRRDGEKAFEAADEGRKGYLSREDYKVAVISLLGYKPSKYELNSVWKTHCLGREGAEGAELCQGLSKTAFLQIMQEREQDKDDLIRQVFLTFDPHGRGFVTLEACRKAFEEVAAHVAEEEVEAMFSEVDGNCDGRVSYRDFELIMKHFQLVPPESPAQRTH